MGIRRWPFVSLNMQPEHLREWGSIARLLGRSRADLMREALEMVGLPYARGVAKTVQPRAETSQDKESA